MQVPRTSTSTLTGPGAAETRQLKAPVGSSKTSFIGQSSVLKKQQTNKQKTNKKKTNKQTKKKRLNRKKIDKKTEEENKARMRKADPRASIAPRAVRDRL